MLLTSEISLFSKSGNLSKMSDNFESIFDATSTSKNAPAKGRRAGRSTLSQPSVDKKSEVNEPAPMQETEADKPLRPGRRRQMWSTMEEETIQDSRLIQQDVDSINEDDDTDSIPVIPDLEQMNDEPMADKIAAPPTSMVNELLSYRELDTDLLRQTAFQMLDNEIDLKILTKSIVPESATFEPDETWEMDKLFADMKTNISSSNKNTFGREKIDEGSEKKEALI